MKVKTRLLSVVGLCSIIVLGQTLAQTSSAAEVIETESGAPLKVVVRQDCAIYEEPSKESNNRPVKMFNFFYVLKASEHDDQKLHDDFYRIATSTRNNSEVGWIHKSDVVEWPHRQAIGLRPLQGRQPADFYASKEEVQSAYSKDKPVTPFSKEIPGNVGINLMPILDKFSMKDSFGDDVSGYRVAYLHAAGTPDADLPQVSPADRKKGEGVVDLDKSTLDVVFVIDTTTSMKPYIDATKTLVTQLVDRLSTEVENVPVRFAIVGYRDAVQAPKEGWYVTKIHADLEQGADHAVFQKMLSEVIAAETGSEDFKEDVFAGLKVGLQDVKWNPDAFKHVVLIGDASAQTEMGGIKNVEKLQLEGVIALAQPRGSELVKQQKVIHAVRILGEDVSDHRDAESQFKQLAAGESYPGKYLEFNRTDNTNGFVDQLLEEILKSAKGLSKAKQGNVKSIAKDTPGLGLLLQMVHASAETTDENSKAGSFASGYACEVDLEGNLMLEPFVLVQYGRLELFDAALDFSVKSLKNSGEPGARDVQQVVQNMQIFATQINVGEPIDPNTELSKVLSMVLGFPVKNKIFEMTFSKLTSMTEVEFQNWLKQVEASRSIIRSHLDQEQIWFSLGANQNPQDRHGFLKVKDLP